MPIPMAPAPPAPVVPNMRELADSVGNVAGANSFNPTSAVQFIIQLLAIALLVIVAWKALQISMSDKSGQVDVAAKRGAVQGIAMFVFGFALVLSLVVGAFVTLLRSFLGG